MKYTAEVLTALAALAGWTLLTYTTAALISGWAWPLSAGLLLLSLAGFRLLAVVAWEGLYALSRDDDGEEGDG